MRLERLHVGIVAWQAAERREPIPGAFEVDASGHLRPHSLLQEGPESVQIHLRVLAWPSVKPPRLRLLHGRLGSNGTTNVSIKV